MKNSLTIFSLLTFCLAFFVGCGQKPETPPKTETTSASGTQASTSSHTPPSDVLGPFTLSASEYPSWVPFKVAGRAGLINPEKGGTHGPLEVKWGCDIVVDYTGYDECLQNYGNGTSDAVCVTNGDALTQVGSRSGCGIMPTSTSNGADAIMAYGVSEIEGLKGVNVRGLSKSVSEFTFIRVLQKRGLNPADFDFGHMDPEAAAIQLQGNTNGSGEVQAATLWNPFVMQTKERNSKINLIGDSTEIPEEIVDMVLVSQDSLNREGGDRFAHLVCDIFYTVSDKLADRSSAEAMRGELGKDFANLDAEKMVTILQQTSFYATPQDGSKLFNSVGFQDIMSEKGVVPQTYVLMDQLEESSIPSVSFDGSDADLQFSTDYMEYVKNNR